MSEPLEIICTLFPCSCLQDGAGGQALLSKESEGFTAQLLWFFMVKLSVIEKKKNNLHVEQRNYVRITQTYSC